jgi:hypothetical protein
LDRAAEFLRTSIECKTVTDTPRHACGAWWMNRGIDFDADFREDLRAAAFRMDKK